MLFFFCQTRSGSQRIREVLVCVEPEDSIEAIGVSGYVLVPMSRLPVVVTEKGHHSAG